MPSIATPSGQVDGNTVTRPARLFKSGEYEFDRGIFREKLAITPDQLDRIISQSASIDKIPLDLSPVHGMTDLNLPPDVTGYIPGTSLKRDGEWIVGDVTLPKVIDSNLRNRGLSIHLSRSKGRMERVCVTGTPKVKGACFSEVEGEDAFCFADGEMETEEAVQPPPEPQKVDTTDIQSVLEALRGIGLDLPEDTTDANFKDRIIVAARAMAGGDKQEEQANETDIPAPIAMSEGTMTTNTDGAITFSEPSQTLPLSLKKAYRKQYAQRIERLVQTRRVTAKYANERLAGHLGKNDGDFTFAVTDSGDVAKPLLDELLMALEGLPEGCCLTGPVAATDKALKNAGTPAGDIRFSLRVSEQDVDPPAEFGDDPEEAKRVREDMLAMSGVTKAS